MDRETHTIEDLLELITGLQESTVQFVIQKPDLHIMNSISRQVFKGVALTDRQLILIKEKLYLYQDQFIDTQHNFDIAIENLRLPLRQINREKYIKIVSSSSVPEIASRIHNGPWIKIRFPFAKKLIILVDALLKNKSEYFHHPGSHEHYLKLTEQSVYDIVSIFKNKEFKIDDELINIHLQLDEMKNNKENFIPGIYNFKLKNLNDRAISHMISTIGKPSKDNLALYKDRNKYYGIHHFDQNDLDDSIFNLTPLSQKIVNRKMRIVLIKKSKYTFSSIAESLLELNRFPLIVLLSDINPLSDLIQIHNAFNGFISNNEQSVLFRLDNTDNSEFNHYIKRNNLNSPLDKSLKVVYINNNKIPKPLLKTEWQGSTVLSMSSFRMNTKVKVLVDEMDLVIQYDTDVSQFMRAGIEEL